MAASGGKAGEIDKLKALLFSPEAARLTAAEAQIEGLESRVGDARRLEAATAEILVEAFQKAEGARHRELATAVAPVVIAAIRSEIKNSRDIMVEALYPITGRLVSAAVANAFRELIISINQRLDAILSSRQWKMRLQSWPTGRPIGEIALSQAFGSTFERLLFFERGSGRLLANWRRDGQSEDNPELVSGMIAAVSEFATSVLSDRHGELRTLDLGPSKVYLRASTRVILAAEIAGDPSAEDLRRLDAEFLELVGRQDHGDEVGDADLAALVRRSNAPQSGAGAGRSGRRWAIAGVIGALILGYWLVGTVSRWRKEAAIAGAFEQALASRPALAPYPLRLDIDSATRRVTLRGLAAAPADIEALSAAITPAAAPYDFIAAVAVVDSPASIASAKAEFDARLADLAARTTQIEQKLSAIDAGHGGAVEDLRTQTALGLAARDAALVAARGEADKATAAAARASDDLRAQVQALRDQLALLEQQSGARIDALAGALAAKTDHDRAEAAKSASGLDAQLGAAETRLAAAERGDEQIAARLASLETAVRAHSEQDAAQATTIAGLVANEVGALEARIKSALNAAQPTDDQSAAALAARVAALEEGLASPRRQLLERTRQAAIFFAQKEDFADAEAASATLDAVAALLRKSGEGVRVVGYADDTGGDQLNIDGSRHRAAKVASMLVDRGIAADRIVVVGRAARDPIVETQALNHSRNRRVTFEPLYSGELGP